MSEVFTIVGCGDSAQNWVPRGHSIGVNDSWKWGKPTDSLLCCNRPNNFNIRRLKTISESKPKTFYTHKANWSHVFPEWKKINLVTWYGTLFRPHVYSSNTSPFIALSLAFHLGAKEIIMWGVDFIDHGVFNSENPETSKEVGHYMELINEMKLQGTSVWLGNTGTAFDDKLQLWTKQ